MHGDWRLRRAAKADAEIIAAIFTSSRRAAMPYLPVLYTELEVLHWIKDVVLGNSCVIVAVSDDGQPGGFAAIRSSLLEHLYVAPHFQRRGLGTLGTKQTSRQVRSMSALGGKADIRASRLLPCKLDPETHFASRKSLL